ncbi:hypothetical protein Gekk315_00047 [Aeromonas phage Gekk3-15]
MAGNHPKQSELVRKVVDPWVAYRDGFQSRALNLPYQCPQKYDWALMHFWFAGWNDLDISLREKAKNAEKVYIK